jgi:hypothetical protein
VSVTALKPASGLLLFIQYGFMPNHLGYCGGNENQLLLEHAAAKDADPALPSLLAKFTGAYPYLRTIAQANGIANPFDLGVVEAYWIGNRLLDSVEASSLSRSLEERFGRQLTPRLREQILSKPPQGARPFHLFHVIDVYRHLESKEISMAAMENCRISWGKVKKVEGAELLVDRRPLVSENGKLRLGEPRAEKVLRSLDGKGFVDSVGPGDVVSIHWGWACDVLDRRKLANLVHYTNRHLDLANQTI